MLELVSVVLLGFFLGMRHATDPDHVIAVTTIVSRERTVRSAALIGTLWGVGHTLTVLLAGGAIILFELVIPPRIGLGMAFSVALMLIVLGLWNLMDLRRWIGRPSAPEEVHSHPHNHGDYVHTHLHGHGPGAHGHDEAGTSQAWLDRTLGRLGFYQALRPLVVGLVHGLAGSAAVALLVLATIRDPVWAMAYLVVFGIGTIAGMLLITAVLALPLAYTAHRFAATNRYLAVASGLLSLGFGIFLAYQIGVIDGLFTSHPRWTPE